MFVCYIHVDAYVFWKPVRQLRYVGCHLWQAHLTTPDTPVDTTRLEQGRELGLVPRIDYPKVSPGDQKGGQSMKVMRDLSFVHDPTSPTPTLYQYDGQFHGPTAGHGLSHQWVWQKIQ